LTRCTALTNSATDKAPEGDKAAANKKFQEIAFAYAVLSDEKRRKRYDLTGSTSETMDGDDGFDWHNFYRQQFDDLITEENIKNTKAAYKGSEEERQDLLKAYKKFKGRFSGLYECVLLSDIEEDDDRFRKILDEEIAKGTIESYPAYERENNDASRAKAKAAERKRKEAFDKQHGDWAEEKMNGKSKAKKSKESDLTSLAAAIQKKSRTGGNFLDQLEAKYAPKSRGKKRGSDDEPPEEMFLAAEARAKKARQSKRPKKAEPEEEDLDAMLEEEDLEDESEEEETPPPKKRGRLIRGRAKA